jgi:hypothetical protein
LAHKSFIWLGEEHADKNLKKDRMVPAFREKFNREFTPKKYYDYLEELNSLHPGDIEFRVAETPIFVDRAFKEKILSACESIVDVITQPDFLSDNIWCSA